MFKLDTPIPAVKQITKDGKTESKEYFITDIEIPDVVSVGMMRNIKADPRTELYKYAADLVAACSDLSAIKANRMSANDCLRYFNQIADRCTPANLEEHDTAKRLNQILPVKYDLRDLMRVKANTEVQPVEWCAQVLEYCGKMKRNEVNELSFNDFSALMPLIQNNVCRQDIVEGIYE